VTAPRAPRPWWWLSGAECAALGIGEGARRTDRGVVFGADTSPLRLELVPRSEDAPVKIGGAALRLWGPSAHPAARRLLVLAARILQARAGEGFDPAAVSFDAPAPRADPAPGVTLVDVPSVCERACLFCGISLRPRDQRRPRGADEDVERAIAAARGPVLFTGDDALSHPRIVAFVERAAAGGRAVSLIGPPRRGATAALAPALARAGLRRYETAILGDGPSTHDPIAGLEGAFDALVEAASAMRAAGVSVELVTPLVTPLLGALPAIAARAVSIAGAPPTLLAYAPDEEVGTAFDAIVPRFDALRAALAPLFAAGGPRPGLDALPLCVLPESLRAGAAARLERSVGVVYPEATCAGCDLRAACPGVATTVMRAAGGEGLVTLRRRERFSGA
jgi:hypothetical protein